MKFTHFFLVCFLLSLFLGLSFGQRGRPRQNRQQNNIRQQNNNNNNNRRQHGTNPRFAFGLDTSDLASQRKYAPFDGPVKGLPSGHGGGRFGAANCLLCG